MSTNDAPPYIPVIYGKRQTLPSPMAQPAETRMKPSRVEKFPRSKTTPHLKRIDAYKRPSGGRPAPSAGNRPLLRRAPMPIRRHRHDAGRGSRRLADDGTIIPSQRAQEKYRRRSANTVFSRKTNLDFISVTLYNGNVYLYECTTNKSKQRW